MSLLKRFIRKSNRPLQQAVKRYAEQTQFRSRFHLNTPEKVFTYKKQHNAGPVIIDSLLVIKQFKFLLFKNTEIKINSKADCYILTTDKSIVKIVNIYHIGNKETILGYRFTYASYFYQNPLKSTKLNIYEVNDLNNHLESWPVQSILCKCMVLQYAGNKYVAFPLIHTYLF